MITRYRFFLLSLLLAAAFVPGQSRAQGFAVTAGLNFNTLSDIEAEDRDATFENATGWPLGISFELPLGPVSIRPGVRYMDAGSLFESEEIFGQDVPGLADATVELVEVPIDLRFRFGTPLISPYILAGPVLRFPSGTDNGDLFELESFSYAANVGAGLEIGFAGVRLFPELKYTFGVSSVASSFEVGDTTFEPDEGGQLNTIMLSLGVGL